MQQSKKQMNI